MIAVKNQWNFSAAGTQPKWYDPVHDLYYKADDKKWFCGCEGLAETVCSDLLDQSNIGLHANYRPVQIRSGLHVFRGCESKSFRKPGDILLTGIDLTCETDFDLDRLRKEQPVEQTIAGFIELVKQKTGGYDTKNFLCKMLEFDQLVLNSDRNLGNICLIKRPGAGYLPILFDNGRSLATNQIVSRTDRSVKEIVDRTISRPFSMTYAPQVNAMEGLCENHSLFRTTYTLSDLDQSLSKCEGIYPRWILERVREVFQYQYEKHSDYFLTPDRLANCQTYRARIESQCPEFLVQDVTDENGFSLGDLKFVWKKDQRVAYFLSVSTDKLTCLADGKDYPLTPPDLVKGSDRQEIQNFLTQVRTCLTEKRARRMGYDQELER